MVKIALSGDPVTKNYYSFVSLQFVKNFQNETDLHLKETRSRLYYINSTALTNNWAQAEQHRKNTAVWHFIPRVTDVRYDEIYVFVFQSKKKPVKTSLTILFYTGSPKIPDYFKNKNRLLFFINRIYNIAQMSSSNLHTGIQDFLLLYRS